MADSSVLRGEYQSNGSFIIKYLKTFDFQVSNEVFAAESWYFRNALVRANYNNLQNGVYATTIYLEMFFENLLLGKHHNLKNRYLHLGYRSDVGGKTIQIAGEDISKCKNRTLNCTLDELVLLKIIKQEPTITQNELARKVEKSERTIKKRTIELQEKGYIRRLNGKRNGRWEVLGELTQ